MWWFLVCVFFCFYGGCSGCALLFICVCSPHPYPHTYTHKCINIHELTCLTSWISVRRLPAHCMVLVTFTCKFFLGVVYVYMFIFSFLVCFSCVCMCACVGEYFFFLCVCVCDFNTSVYTKCTYIHPPMHVYIHVRNTMYTQMSNKRTCGKLRFKSSSESLRDLPPSTATVGLCVCGWVVCHVCVCVGATSLCMHVPSIKQPYTYICMQSHPRADSLPLCIT